MREVCSKLKTELLSKKMKFLIQTKIVTAKLISIEHKQVFFYSSDPRLDEENQQQVHVPGCFHIRKPLLINSLKYILYYVWQSDVVCVVS